MAREEGITASESWESQNTICKETAAGQPKTGKYDYFTANIHATRSMAWQFFTDDYIALPKAAVAVSL
jgi:hypothetical protein